MRNTVNFAAIIITLVSIIILIWVADAVRRTFFMSDNNASAPANSASISSDSSESNSLSDTESLQVSDNANSSASDSASSASSAETESAIDSSKFDMLSVTSAGLSQGTLVPANASSPLTVLPSESDLSSFENLKNDFYRLRSYDLLIRPDVIPALNSLFEDFNTYSNLKNILIMDAFSSKNADSDLATGYSAELRLLNDDGTNSSFTGADSYKWILENCHNYGFILRYPLGKDASTGRTGSNDILRYTGIPHAKIMYQNNLCLEEYLEYIKSYSYDNPLIFENYTIYYAALSTASASIPVPKSTDYSISGNNKDGFIISYSN